MLDRGQLAHVAFVDEGTAVLHPDPYTRTGNRLLIHGSSASRMVRRLAAGASACVTVTILDGLVLARSAFEHSINYYLAVLIGTFQPITDPCMQKLAALEMFLERLLPGRWGEVRPPNRKELKATTVLAMQIGEASVKTRSAPPDLRLLAGRRARHLGRCDSRPHELRQAPALALRAPRGLGFPER